MLPQARAPARLRPVRIATRPCRGGAWKLRRSQGTGRSAGVISVQAPVARAATERSPRLAGDSVVSLEGSLLACGKECRRCRWAARPLMFRFPRARHAVNPSLEARARPARLRSPCFAGRTGARRPWRARSAQCAEPLSRTVSRAGPSPRPAAWQTDRGAVSARVALPLARIRQGTTPRARPGVSHAAPHRAAFDVRSSQPRCASAISRSRRRPR